MKVRSLRAQIFRFALVGVASNILLYVAYIGLTSLGAGPKLAMTTTFSIGVAQTFWMNSGWTFAHRGSKSLAFARYWSAYAAAYVLNFCMLVLFVDVLGYPHQIVQGGLVLAIAALLFALQKFWVFAEVGRATDAEAR